MSDSDESDRTEKSAAAFRTISEVADELGVPQHVLRFWETKFTQVKPMKRAGGRRYYRPDDVQLLRRIQELLYSEGFTIRGVQKLLRERGVRALVNGEGPPDVDTPLENRGAPQRDDGAQTPVAPALPSSMENRRTPDHATRERLKAMRNRLGKLRDEIAGST